MQAGIKYRGLVSETSGLKAATLNEGLACGKLTLKLATTEKELHELFRLRYRIFNEELGEGIPENAASGLDVDDFDRYCDHLMVMDNDRAIGTYRLLHGPRRPPGGFYTQTEFDISGLNIDLENTVELGRGCIDPAYRRQTTLLALFWGLSKYMTSKHARYLLGCSSLPLMSGDDAEATFQSLVAQGKVEFDAGVKPLPANEFSGNASVGQPQLPPLAVFYLEFGARVLGRPAFDPIFRCHDLFMLFDMEGLSPWGKELLARFDKRAGV